MRLFLRELSLKALAIAAALVVATGCVHSHHRQTPKETAKTASTVTVPEQGLIKSRATALTRQLGKTPPEDLEKIRLQIEKKGDYDTFVKRYQKAGELERGKMLLEVSTTVHPPPSRAETATETAPQEKN
jgi:hypothetical protein